MMLCYSPLLNYILNPIATIPAVLAECRASKALIHKLSQTLCQNAHPKGECVLQAPVGEITLSNLSFSYDGEQSVLQNLNFSFEEGKSYCIVGASGSGKSTLLRLLAASYREYTGEIRYGVWELRSIDSASLYDVISMIDQNVFVFNSTVRENITMFSDFSNEAFDRSVRFFCLLIKLSLQFFKNMIQ